MNLQDLKNKTPADLILEAEKLGIENPSTMRKQEILFGILKKLAEKMKKLLEAVSLKHYKMVLVF